MKLESSPVSDPNKHTEKECKLNVENNWDSEVLPVCLVQKVHLGDEVDRHHKLHAGDDHGVEQVNSCQGQLVMEKLDFVGVKSSILQSSFSMLEHNSDLNLGQMKIMIELDDIDLEENSQK